MFSSAKFSSFRFAPSNAFDDFIHTDFLFFHPLPDTSGVSFSPTYYSWLSLLISLFLAPPAISVLFSTLY